MINQTADDINTLITVKNYLDKLANRTYYVENPNLKTLEECIDWVENILSVLTNPEFGQEEFFDPSDLMD